MGTSRLQRETASGTPGRVLLLAWLLFGQGSAQGPASQCCRTDGSWITGSRNCTDGGRLRLECPSGFYALEPGERYAVLEGSGNGTGWLNVQDVGYGSYNVSPDRYCINKVLGKEDQEMVLVCFTDEVEFYPLWWNIFFGLISILSSLFLALTLLVYLILPEMRDIQDKAMMSVTVSFMVAFFLIGNQHLQSSMLNDDTACIFVAFTMYYAYMCAFFWLNIISFNIWRSVWFPTFKLHNHLLFTIYSAIGWGLPFCFLAATLIAHNIEGTHLRPGFGEIGCWFSSDHATWAYFYGPILVLLSINLIYLGCTSWKLWHVYKGLECCRLQVLRFKCLMYVKLGALMGFTWIFEIISFACGQSNKLYWIVPDMLNVLQGLFIFILLVISRKRVKKLLAKRRPFNIPFPKSWAAYADEENCEPVGAEELELST